MRKEIHQSKCEEWEKLIDQWIGSGLSKKQWCNENNIIGTKSELPETLVSIHSGIGTKFDTKSGASAVLVLFSMHNTI